MRFTYNGGRPSVRLGAVSKRQAESFQHHLDIWLDAIATGTIIPTDTKNWLIALPLKTRDKFRKLGLTTGLPSELIIPGVVDGPPKPGEKPLLPGSLGAYMRAYIQSRDDLGESSIMNYRQVERQLNKFFGDEKQLRSIAKADAERFRRYLLSLDYAQSTVSKLIKRAKTMFKEAEDGNILVSSPFKEQRGMSEANKARQFFITRKMAKRVVEACPNHDWKLIFLLSRYGGMRCPCEVTTMKWADVLWSEQRLIIRSPKTGLRVCPIFPELLPFLREAYQNRATGEKYCVSGYRGNRNLGTQMHRIVKAAGLEPWPKTFVNLRSSRRTELQEKFPSHVIDEWLGHSSATAEKHYLQVTDDHWADGASLATSKKIKKTRKRT